jgi:hypothetical protein
MSLKFPDPTVTRELLRDIHNRAVVNGESHVEDTCLPVLVSFQANTIDALADYLIAEARKLELTNKTITFADLKAAGAKLREYSEQLAPRSAAEEATR